MHFQGVILLAGYVKVLSSTFECSFFLNKKNIKTLQPHPTKKHLFVHIYCNSLMLDRNSKKIRAANFNLQKF